LYGRADVIRCFPLGPDRGGRLAARRGASPAG
jgi:hypothetical protein